mmetsp:Transcript_44187/g.79494  ORF Transcript_44187/g.79494 Transcript_44187/m.79494 type:complete len:111 (+) Transcript_44187:768-1100(+)
MSVGTGISVGEGATADEDACSGCWLFSVGTGISVGERGAPFLRFLLEGTDTDSVTCAVRGDVGAGTSVGTGISVGEDGTAADALAEADAPTALLLAPGIGRTATGTSATD